MERREVLRQAAAALGTLGLAEHGLARDAAPDPLATLDGSAQAALVRAGTVSPLELVDAAIARIERLNPRLNALVETGFEQARARAKRGVGAGDGPFPGVPYAIKDLLDVQGLRRTSGSRLLRAQRPQASAELVLRSEAGGLIVLGKTNTPEFALNASTEPLLFGPSRNPWDPQRSAGGSSGGAAVAVASGMLPLAHASDGGGSIRIPASCCGLFGLKPSRSRMVGSLPTDSGVEHALCRSVRDSARLFAWNQRRDAQAPLPPMDAVEGPSPRRLRIGLCVEDVLGRPPSAEVRAATEAAARLCESLGHAVQPVRLPVDGERFMDSFMVAWSGGAERMLQLAESQGADPEQVLEPWTRHLAAHARGLPAEALPAARAVFAQVGRDLDALLTRVDVLLTPVLADEPPPLGVLGPQVAPAQLWERLMRYVGYTPMHNVAGTPAMSVPLGRSRAGLPIGTQFAARVGAEGLLFALAFELEAARPWTYPVL
ncbi:amidase [Pelomonas sp. CA6]|uniref:amidase n=1 Tax=Pelomonas sp. CA6 TaxID=2907999 RepID=UPI001F4BCF17|nr:amidase [Pelomonas sp. CA6]MCH7343154.1 amidase [Pelomonas sp. CA6]